MKKSGFTLIELMIVVAIIAIIAAIAIPNLLRSRIQSNEAAAIGNLRTIFASETSYHSANANYTNTFAPLTGATPPFLDGDWSVARTGYSYTMAGTVANFTCNANPVNVGVTGVRYFYTDGSGIIRYANGAAATGTSSPIGQ